MTEAQKNGESLVASELEKRGFVILCRNFRRRGFELDIVALKGSLLAILEVKVRNQSFAFESLISSKQRAAHKRGVRCFISEFPGDYEIIRLDVVIVQNNHIVQYFENAYSLND